VPAYETFQPTVDVKTIDTQHPELAHKQQLYEDLRLLYHGGKELKDNAFRFLVKRQREISSAFIAREQKINFDPVLGTVVSFYVSKLYENGIEIEFSSKESGIIDEFYTDFIQQCDRGDMSLETFFTRVTEEILVFGKSFYLLDLPKPAVAPSNLAEQKMLKGLDPYLVHVHVPSVINWQKDSYGNFEWVVVANKQVLQNFLGKPATQLTWTYYNTTQYAIYQASYTEAQAKPTTAILIDSGVHAMAEQNVVPLVCVESKQHWLGNRLYLSLIEHFNAYNSLAWSLWQALNPVISISDGSDKPIELSQTVSEFSFLHLPYQSKAEWLEPEGTSWDVSLKYLEELRQNIYRMSHVTPLGRSSRATPAAQSGVARVEEMAPAASVLNNIGSLIKNVLQQTLDAIAAIRGENVKSDLRGFSFVQDQSASNIDIALAFKALDIQSVTALRESQKQVVRSLFRNDANAALVDKMTSEIDAAPDAAFEPAPGAPPTGQVALNITERTGNPGQE
jgi:hypothetical protein